MQLPGHAPNYSRVLVGSVSTVCQRLQDEDGKMGLFFFAHDLGIRTEGTFTLRFSLTNLASSVFYLVFWSDADLPSLMTSAVMPGDMSKVLAQVYSDPFTV